MNKKHFLSPLFLKLTGFILICVFSLLTAEIVFSAKLTKKHCFNDIKEMHDLNSSKISFMLSKALWDYDKIEILNILDNEMLIEDVFYIRLSDFVSDEKQLILYEKIKDETNKIRDYNQSFDSKFLEKNTMLTFKKDVIYNAQKIGVLEIFVSSLTLKKQFNNNFYARSLHSLIIFILLPILLFVGCNFIFLNPLSDLIMIVKAFSLKNSAIRTRNTSRDEIGELGKAFNQMADSIEDKNKQLLKQLYFDPLTKLPNRTKLIKDMQTVSNGIIFIFDIDSFREINDFYGHKVGDEILVEIAERLQKVNFSCDFTIKIYHLNADEFAILLDKGTNYVEKNRFHFHSSRRDSLSNEVRTIIGAFVFFNINDKAFICNESEININATVGAAKITDITNVSALYNADMALKKAKQLHKHYILYDETMQIAKEYENNIRWTYILKEAISKDQVLPFFQPIVNNQTGIIEKYECLCRIINSNNDIISPYYFLDIAKKIRLYPNITRKIILKSFERFSDLPYDFSINISVFDIQNDETRHYIKSILLGNPKTAKRVVFELLESDGIQNYDIVKSFIEEVKAFGCKIAIDDFGSGYSNFDHVMSLDVDILKIDASMIKNLDTEKQSQIITKTIVNFTKELNIKTVSEFVHTQEVFKKVKEYGIDYSQGYLFGEPAIDVCKNNKVFINF